MKIIAIAMLIAVALLACTSAPRGTTTQMFPDCTQVSAEQQRMGNCMMRPEPPNSR